MPTIAGFHILNEQNRNHLVAGCRVQKSWL